MLKQLLEAIKAKLNSPIIGKHIRELKENLKRHGKGSGPANR